MVAGDVIGSGAGAVAGALLSWAVTTKTLAPRIVQLVEAVRGVKEDLKGQLARVDRLESLHLVGSAEHLHRRAGE